MSGVALDRRPDFDRELRFRALAAYREHGSYRKTGKAMGLSYKRVQVLVREALRMEMDEARHTKGSER